MTVVFIGSNSLSFDDEDKIRWGSLGTKEWGPQREIEGGAYRWRVYHYFTLLRVVRV